MPVRLLRQEMAKARPFLPGSWWVAGCSFLCLSIFLLSTSFPIAFYCNREDRPFQRPLESFREGSLSQRPVGSVSSVQDHGVLVPNESLSSVRDHGVLDPNQSLPSGQDHGVLDPNESLSSAQDHGVVDRNERFGSVQHHGVLDPKENFSFVHHHAVLDPHESVDPNESFSSVQDHGVLNPNCNLFAGSWVYDNKSLPLYKDWNCSFMIDDLACEKYGRKDLDYQYWRWQPDDCDLPEFDAKALLNKLRDKRLVFVGDSLNRNQWVSLMCLIESSIPSGLKSMSWKGNLYIFEAKEYNARIDFYWAPLLVESNSDDPTNHHLDDRVVRVRSIEKHAKHWADADILIFNSYLWWEVATMKVSQESLENPKPNAIYRRMKPRKCYSLALKTWSKWVLRNVDGNKTRLFWMGESPPHSQAANWGRADDQSRCYNETQPIAKEQLRGIESNPEMMRLTERAVESLKVRGLKIDLLDITGLSAYRKDGHPTVYRKLWRPLPRQQLASPLNWADCTHWCLPGVPDVWNHLLYTYLV